MTCKNCGQKIKVRKLVTSCACEQFDSLDLDIGFAPLASDLPIAWKPNRYAIANAINDKLISDAQGSVTVMLGDVYCGD